MTNDDNISVILLQFKKMNEANIFFITKWQMAVTGTQTFDNVFGLQYLPDNTGITCQLV
jgi:hypothetical protein